MATGDRLRLHVTNGSAAVGRLRGAGIEGEVLPWDDVLHDGPVPPLDPEAFRAVRARWLADAFGEPYPEVSRHLTDRDARLGAAFAGGASEVVLWFEADLYDQLQRLDVLGRAREAGVRVSEAVVPGYVGETDDHGIQTAFAERRPPDASALADAEAAWRAVRAPTPRPLVAWAASASASPLRAAARRLLAELPGPDGLARSERNALQALVDGPLRASEVFRRVQAAEDWRYLGDAAFALVLERLAAKPRPLVAFHPAETPRSAGGGGPATPFWGQTARLTATGADVLAGRADRVACVGLDRWVGGTHLTPASVWRFDGAALTRDATPEADERRIDPAGVGPRRAVWEALADLWLDTEPAPVDAIARVLAASPFSIDELEAIYGTEVAPVLWPNLRSVAGVWDAFDPDWLAEGAGRWHARRASAPWRLWARLRRRAWTRGTEAAWQRVTEAAARLRA